jgi:hypothetical protein
VTKNARTTLDPIFGSGIAGLASSHDKGEERVIELSVKRRKTLDTKKASYRRSTPDRDDILTSSPSRMVDGVTEKTHKVILTATLPKKRLGVDQSRRFPHGKQVAKLELNLEAMTEGKIGFSLEGLAQGRLKRSPSSETINRNKLLRTVKFPQRPTSNSRKHKTSDVSRTSHNSGKEQ